MKEQEGEKNGIYRDDISFICYPNERKSDIQAKYGMIMAQPDCFFFSVAKQFFH